MKFSEIKLPSNRKFGFFFTCIFAVVSVYFLKSETMMWVYTFISASFIFLVITLVKDELLLPLNKLWMRFGVLLGIIVSPIILGLIFYGLFMPTSIIMRLFGRDELRLKFSNKASHWITRYEPLKSESFKNQF